MNQSAALQLKKLSFYLEFKSSIAASSERLAEYNIHSNLNFVLQYFLFMKKPKHDSMQPRNILDAYMKQQAV